MEQSGSHGTLKRREVVRIVTSTMSLGFVQLNVVQLHNINEYHSAVEAARIHLAFSL